MPVEQSITRHRPVSPSGNRPRTPGLFIGGSWQVRSLPAPWLTATATAAAPGTFPSAAVPASGAREEEREVCDRMDREKAENSCRLSSGHLGWGVLAMKPQGACEAGEAPCAQHHERGPGATAQPGAESPGAETWSVPCWCPRLGIGVLGQDSAWEGHAPWFGTGRACHQRDPLPSARPFTSHMESRFWVSRQALGCQGGPLQGQPPEPASVS